MLNRILSAPHSILSGDSKKQHKEKCDFPTQQLGYSNEQWEDCLLGFAPESVSVIYTSID